MIDPTSNYHIGEAAKLVGVDRHTLLRDVKNDIIHCITSPKSGRKIFRGRDLIYYIQFIK